ncbi:MAG TPA: N-acetylmuramic acid 6-phosphate etherase [Kofleriaceae bacterium]|nr:N-acetylmuramic acid 6-phosphate etherase [Kofleriaceae bacterium]
MPRLTRAFLVEVDVSAGTLEQSNLIPLEETMTSATEDVARRFDGLDSWSTGEILETLWNSQSRAVAACLPALPHLEGAVVAATARLARGEGRLAYAGAGSSGLIAALDALDLGPTFDWPEARIAIFVAGAAGFSRPPDPAAEDDAAGGRARAHDARLGVGDVLVGVSASGSSAFTVAVLEEARRAGALTVAFASQADSPLVHAAEHAVVVATGAEVIAGSTRLGAGTAQKVMLNLFSTAIMVGLGFVFDNLMINVRAENAKLRHRRAAIVASIAGVDLAVAAAALARHGDVKRAVLGLAGLSPADTEAALARSGGNLRVALGAAGGATAARGRSGGRSGP